jgi:hypothetical protein
MLDVVTLIALLAKQQLTIGETYIIDADFRVKVLNGNRFKITIKGKTVFWKKDAVTALCANLWRPDNLPWPG